MRQPHTTRNKVSLKGSKFIRGSQSPTARRIKGQEADVLYYKEKIIEVDGTSS
jgi:hypothetical protein